MILSIIIVNWNTRDLLHGCLTSIAVNLLEVEFEIIVVDNGSTDGSTEMVREKYPHVKLIQNFVNVGFARANNLGLRLSTGKYVLLLNSDTEAMQASLDTMVSFLDIHPKVGIVGCRLVDSAGVVEESCGHFPTLKAIMLTKLNRLPVIGQLFKNSRASILAPSDKREVDWVTGACMLVRREVINQVGGLDEDIFMYFEDYDLCARAKKNGWEIWVITDASVMHHRGASLKKVPDRLILAYRQSQMVFYRSHLGIISRWGLCIMIFSHSIFSICKYALLQRVSRKNRTEASAVILSHWQVILMILGLRD